MAIIALILSAIIVSISYLLYDMYSQKIKPISMWATKNKEFNDQIKFIRKPNVYLIITESYPNKESLRQIYNIENSNFYEKLEKLEFTLHHNYYSNYNHTLASLPSLFGMEHHYYSITLTNLDSIGGRSMLEANTYNPVVDIFRQNNYKIQYIHTIGTLFPKGASVDYCSPTPPIYLALEIFLSHQDTTKKSIFSSQDPRDPNFFKTLKERFSLAASNDTPNFIFIYTGQPGHSPSRIKSRNRSKINKILEMFRQNYDKNILAGNTHLLEIIDLILKNDDDPLIIIAGDHGTWGYRIKEDGNNKRISDSLFALDRFGILMGIRFPKSYDRQFDNDFKTHVNLFRIVFAYLSNNNKILKKKVEDNSYDYGPHLAIRDGIILNRYMKMRRMKVQN